MNATTTTTMNNQHITSSHRRRRVVSFAETAKMRLALHVNDFTDEEYYACFYSPQDYKRFKHEIKQTIVHHRNHKSSRDDDKYCCTRGIEHRLTKESSKQRSTIMTQAKLAVLGEQTLRGQICDCNKEHEHPKNDNEDVQIASSYSKYAMTSRIQALMMGIADQIIASDNDEESTASAKWIKGMDVTTPLFNGNIRSDCTSQLIQIIMKHNSMHLDSKPQSASNATFGVHGQRKLCDPVDGYRWEQSQRQIQPTMVAASE